MADQKPARPEVKKTDERKSNRIKCSKPKGKPNPNNRLKKNQTNQKIVMNKEQNPAVKGKEIQKITAVSEKPLAPEQKKPVDTEASKPAEMNKELQSEFNMELKESLENLLVSLLTDGDSEEAGQKAESTLESLIPQKPEQKDLLTILTVFDEVLQNLQNQEAEETVCNLFSSSVMKDYLKQYSPFSEPKTARLLIRVYAEYKNPLNFPVNLNPERILYGYSEGNVKHSPYSCEVTEAVISQLQESDLDRLLFEWLNTLFFFDPRKIEVERKETGKIPYKDKVMSLTKKIAAVIKSAKNNPEQADNFGNYIQSRLTRYFNQDMSLKKQIALMALLTSMKPEDSSLTPNFLQIFQDKETQIAENNSRMKSKEELLGSLRRQNQLLMDEKTEQNKKQNAMSIRLDEVIQNNHRLIEANEALQWSIVNNYQEIRKIKAEYEVYSDEIDEENEKLTALNETLQLELAQLQKEYTNLLSDNELLHQALKKKESEAKNASEIGGDDIAREFVRQIGQSFDEMELSSKDFLEGRMSPESLNQQSGILMRNLQKFLQFLNIERIGQPGETVPYDPAVHSSYDPASTGDRMIVYNTGWKRNGKIIVKAEVEKEME